MGVIYLLTCRTSGGKYVGQTIHTARYRWNQHVWEANHPEVNQSRKLNNAICKYGPDAFMIENIIECDDEELNHWEILCIELENTFNTDLGYNLTKGGRNNQEVSQETRDKLSKALKGKPKNVKNNRKRREDWHLPKYLKHYIDNKCEGYKVSDHPGLNGTSISFTKSNESLETKFMKAMEILDALNDGTYIVERKELPVGIQAIPGGYRVRVKGYGVKTFQNKKYSAETKLKHAKKYLDSIIK